MIMNEVFEFNEKIAKMANGLTSDKAIVFTAGSYSNEKPDQVSWALVILHKPEEKPIPFSGIAKEQNKEGEKKTGHRNIFGEVYAAEKAFDWAKNNGIKTLYLYSMYKEIHGWLKENHDANYKMTQKFQRIGLDFQTNIRLLVGDNYKVISKSKYGKMAKDLAQKVEE